MSLTFTLKSVALDELKSQAKPPTAVEAAVSDFTLALVEAGVGSDEIPAAITDTITVDGEERHVGIKWEDCPDELKKAVTSDTRGKGGANAPKGIPTIVRKVNSLHGDNPDKYPLRAAHQNADGIRPWNPEEANKAPKDGYLFIGAGSLFPTRITKPKSDGNAEAATEADNGDDS